MLRNENYIGLFTWNRRRFEQKPGTNSYRHVKRPESEHIKKEFPELRIVSQELWERVQAALGEKRTARTAHLGMGTRPGNLLSGLLKCVCGGSITVVSRRYKNGVAYTRLACGIRRSRGPAICSNHESMSERRVTSVVIGALKEKLSNPALTDIIMDSFKKHMNELAKADGTSDLERQLRQAEQRLANITEALTFGFSESIHRQVKIEDENVARVRAQLSAAKRDSRTKVVPHPKAIKRFIDHLLEVLEADDQGRARATLLKHMPPLVVAPTAGGYRVSGAFGISFDFAENPGGADQESALRRVGGTGIEPATKRV
jgi:site-specific DNA recombinase